MLLSDPSIDVNKGGACNVTNHPSVLPVIMVKLFLSQPIKIDVNQRGCSGSTPLYLACEKGHIEVVKLLLSVPTIDANDVGVCL